MVQPLTSQVEHVVVLMLENRSFDNVLGGLYPALTRQGLYRGLLGTETNPLDPAIPAHGSVTVFQGPAAQSTWIMPYPDPGELYSDMVQQIFGSNASVLPSGVLPPMSGFAWNYARQPPSVSGPGWPSVPPVPSNIMQYYSGSTMPVTAFLASQFAVCDAWFAAGPVQTLSNRVFTHCGTPTRVPGTNQSRINNPDFTSSLTLPFVPPVTDTTIFELLDNTYPTGKAPACSNPWPWQKCPSAPALNWKVYYHDAPLSALCDYVYQHWCYDYRCGGNVESFDSGTAFENDIKNGLLPKYSFIEPRYSNAAGGTVNSNHPGGAGLDWSNLNGESVPPPIDVRDGEALLCQIYSILCNYPAVFARTLLIVTYDEHGGLFDHVPPPPAVSPFARPVSNFGYDRYGPRVPVLLINPAITPSSVYPPRHSGAPVPLPPFDHTSILSTLIAQFSLGGTLSPRVAQAPTLAGLIPDPPVPRPCLPCTPPVVRTSQVPPRRPPVTGSPRNARNLSAALAPLYQIVRKAKRRPRC